VKIKQLDLTNIGRFEQLTLPLANQSETGSNITVITGSNGTGKTTLLKALTTALSWFVARLRREKGNGTTIAEIDIKNGQSSAQISLQAEYSANKLLQWSTSKARQGHINIRKSTLAGATQLAEHYRLALTDNDTTALPLIFSYGVDRYVLKFDLNLSKEPTLFDQFRGYDGKSANFLNFFSWFKQREDIENEQRMAPSVLAELKKDLSAEQFSTLQARQELLKDKPLEAVRQAISTFMPGYNNLQIRRQPQPHMTIDKDNESLDINQLSQGEKSLLALIGDIARRLALTHPAINNPLEGDGIILIDEVDLHLHPKWQRSLIDKLTTTFPNCQFILTTHSPLVISDPMKILCYTLDDGELTRQNSLYGLDANQVLLEVMDTDIRNE
jgi:predicted ATP-binding protein involved in virulence